MQLIYSPHDNGYYWERRDWKRSQVFSTQKAAKRALRDGTCVWED